MRVWSVCTMKRLPQLWSDRVVSLRIQRDDNHRVCVRVFVIAQAEYFSTFPPRKDRVAF